MGRRPCCEKEGLNRGAWTALEDKILSDYILAHGQGRWRSIPRESGLTRCGKSCRLRWLNYLRPGIKRGNITPEEEDLIIRLHNLLGNRWSLIAGRIPGRTDNEIKNYWNTTLGKKGKEPKRGGSGKKQVTKDEAKVKAAVRPDDVVRTKAMRCTKQVVLVDPQPEAACTPVLGSGARNEREKGSPSTASEADDLGKLGLDSSICELLLEDMSDPEFWKICQFGDEFNLGGNGNGSPNMDNLLFSEEMTKDWPSDLDDFLQFLA
ncbi:hypothetical protein MLD38_006496 [Melastoma candidum]|uniref:Uncharacterized protein n=1 Tax=Melastoma candidum TaxID=119954 RepID=A0ACB9RN19_9MYRT|nr:hypothetical protein MLD38_006496 [Melastoma candidum]